MQVGRDPGFFFLLTLSFCRVVINLFDFPRFRGVFFLSDTRGKVLKFLTTSVKIGQDVTFHYLHRTLVYFLQLDTRPRVFLIFFFG